MRNFNDVLKVIAEQNLTTPEDVLKEIQLALDEGYNNPDPDVQKQWSQIPCKNDRPTPEEVIIYLVQKLSLTAYRSH